MATHSDKIATSYHEVQNSTNKELYLRISELLNPSRTENHGLEVVALLWGQRVRGLLSMISS